MATISPRIGAALADERAAATGRFVSADVAAAVLAVCDRLEAAAEPFTRMLSESDAKLFSGKSVDWLRARFDAWQRRGLAGTHQGRRYYCECALPAREHLAAARAAGREAARAAMRDAKRAGAAGGEQSAA